VSVSAVVEIVAGKRLMLVKPAADAPPLKPAPHFAVVMERE